MDYLSLTLFLDIAFAGLFLIIFVKESDLIIKQLALYVLSFVVFVVFSQLIFGKQFSAKQDIFISKLEQIKHIIYFFSVTFFIFSRELPKASQLETKSYKNISGFDFILALPIFVFLIYYSTTTGIRLRGEFLDYAGVRSIWVDYMYVYSVACLISVRGSAIISCLILGLALAHLLAGERMRAFVYIVSFLITCYSLDKKRHQASFIFLIGFTLATIIGFLRMGSVQLDNSYNVTHFGSVTISSLYLMDESYSFSLAQKMKFFIGASLANIVPSAFLSEDFNIRLFLANASNIPGGGWLPVWVYSIGGFVGVFFSALAIAIFYRWMLSVKHGVLLTRHDYAKYAMMVVFISTIPRWFMYTPFQIIKMPLYCYILTFLLVGFIQAYSKKRKVYG